MNNSTRRVWGKQIVLLPGGGGGWGFPEDGARTGSFQNHKQVNENLHVRKEIKIGKVNEKK